MPADTQVHVQLDFRIPMRDGVRLYGALYRPAAGQRFPVILSRTIYSTQHPYELTLWETSNLFRAGHRIRLEISSSNFPRFDRNLNTGSEPGLDAEIVVARQTIHHDAQRPSHLTLPVIPRRD